MIVRILSTVAYVILAWWALSPPSDRKSAKMAGIQRAIDYHRFHAERHGRKVMAYEKLYRETAIS